jgi:hypothetical protein
MPKSRQTTPMMKEIRTLNDVTQNPVAPAQQTIRHIA